VGTRRLFRDARRRREGGEQPMTFEFVVNLKTARELGITFPEAIRLQVTEVIE
jgi:ABC-type uncharacterized transport system substrate-binding protein